MNFNDCFFMLRVMGLVVVIVFLVLVLVGFGLAAGFDLWHVISTAITQWWQA